MSIENGFYHAWDEEFHDTPERIKRNDSTDRRGCFAVDRDRIIFSYAFRRLQSKTQVFQSGEYDYYRTRLTHTIEVARIGRALCEHLIKEESNPFHESYFVDPDLVEACCLAHDLGHPCFGHIGERKLNHLMANYGGFEGNAQTLRVMTHLLYDNGSKGMCPTRAFMDGVMKYKRLFAECSPSPHAPCPENHFLYDEQENERSFVHAAEESAGASPCGEDAPFALSIECQIMDWADDIAYSLHDVLDGIQTGFITKKDIAGWAEQMNPEYGGLEKHWVQQLLDLDQGRNSEAYFGQKIGEFIRAATVHESDHSLAAVTNRYAWKLCITEEALAECRLYKKLAHALVFQSPTLQQIEYKGGHLIEQIMALLFDNYLNESNRQLRLLPQHVEAFLAAESTDRAKARRLADYVAELSDFALLRLYKQLFDPDTGINLHSFATGR